MFFQPDDSGQPSSRNAGFGHQGMSDLQTYCTEDDERTFFGGLSDQDTWRPPIHPLGGSRWAATTARGVLQQAADPSRQFSREEDALVLDGDFYGMQRRQQPARDQEAVSLGRVWKSAFAGGPPPRKCCPRPRNRPECSFWGPAGGRPGGSD